MRFKVKLPPPVEDFEDGVVEERSLDELILEAAEESRAPTMAEVAAAEDEAWRKNNTLPGMDSKQRDWTSFNRKLSYMYPRVILPGWKDKKERDR